MPRFDEKTQNMRYRMKRMLKAGASRQEIQALFDLCDDDYEVLTKSRSMNGAQTSNDRKRDSLRIAASEMIDGYFELGYGEQDVADELGLLIDSIHRFREGAAREERLQGMLAAERIEREFQLSLPHPMQGKGRRAFNHPPREKVKAK